MTVKIAILTLSFPITPLFSNLLFRKIYCVSKIRGEIEDSDETETKKGGDDKGVSAETLVLYAKDALNAVTILQTFSMKK